MKFKWLITPIEWEKDGDIYRYQVEVRCEGWRMAARFKTFSLNETRSARKSMKDAVKRKFKDTNEPTN